MRHKSTKATLVAMLILGLAAIAAAGPIIPGIIPGGTAKNDFLGVLPSTVANTPIGGYYNANIYLSGGPATITADYYGGEAGYKNTFNWGNTLLFTHNGGNDVSGSAKSTQNIADVAAGLLPFNFQIFTGASTASVANGSNIPNDNNTLPNFFVSFDISRSAPGGPTSGQSVWIFLDDGGAQNDDNHDDMAIKLTATGGSFSVPDASSTLILLGIGLCSLIDWRRK